MYRPWLVLALLCSVARGQAPSYSSANIVNAVSYAPAPFAPNAVVSIFGTNLSFDPGPFTNTSTTFLPTSLDNVGVYVDGSPAPLLMVSSGQINFIIPNSAIAGTSQVIVVRQGVAGPMVNVTLAPVAPTLFPLPPSPYAIAEDWNNANALITADAPAHAGDTIVLFATGLGAVQVSFDPTAIPAIAAPIADPAALQVLLNGAAIDPSLVKYAGLTPGCAGLYQVNFVLPANTGTDPAIQITLGGQSSQGNLKLAVQ